MHPFHWLKIWLSPDWTRIALYQLEKQMAKDKDELLAELATVKTEIAAMKSGIGDIATSFTVLNQKITDLTVQLAKQGVPQEISDAIDGISADAKDLQDAFNNVLNPTPPAPPPAP